MSKVALLDSKLSNVMVKNISTQNPVSVEPDTSIDVCMSIMLKKDIRHLPLVSQEGDLVGMISIKDCVQIVMDQKEETVQILTNFAMGKSGHFVVDWMNIRGWAENAALRATYIQGLSAALTHNAHYIE